MEKIVYVILGHTVGLRSHLLNLYAVIRKTRERGRENETEESLFLNHVSYLMLFCLLGGGALRHGERRRPILHHRGARVQAGMLY